MLLTVSTLSLIIGAAAPALDAPTAVSSPCAEAHIAALDDVSDLIEKGQKELIAGDTAAALATFEAAHAKSGGKAETDIWVQRARMSSGALDEAFETILELESTVEDRSLMNYAIGVGRYLFAKREEAKAGGAAGGPFDEARGYLKDALDVAPDAYPDAWRMLAESARWVGDPETASMAIDRALETSKDAEILGLAAKIRVAAGSAMLGRGDTKDAGLRLIAQGVQDARAATRALGIDKKNAAALADVNLQLAVGLLFLEKKGDAAGAYAEAMGWDPTQVDYGQLFGILRDDKGTSRPFVDALESGAKKFESRWGKDIASDASLRWWLGYGQRTLGRYDDAIASFEEAVRKFPAFSNSYWYIGLSKYNKGPESYMGAAKSWRQYATMDRDGFIATVKSDPTNIEVLNFAGSRLYAGGRGRNKDGRGVEEAADIAELMLMTDESNVKYWNNVGLFHRDAGQAVAQMADHEPQMTTMEHFERSWDAYGKALELARTSYHLNDAAVLLHYCLERDYDQAIAMYDEAEALATKRLEEGGLSAEEKPLVEIALRDSKSNRALLKAKIEKAKKKAPEGGE